LSQKHQAGSFHIDHIQPLAAAGETVLENLALACPSCSLRKGVRMIAKDPQTGQEAPLFHPRRDHFWDHFAFSAPHLIGKTPTGRATVEALGMNQESTVAARQAGELLGSYPPGDGWPIE